MISIDRRNSLEGLGRRTVQRESRRLLFLDDDPVRAEAFLVEAPEAVWVKTVTDCVVRLVEPWDEVHLDHDLGGKQFVDTSANDCGMEVIRWLCQEPRLHLRQTNFFVHTHNTIAGLMMVLQMRESGYQAEFRPFGVDIAQLLAANEPNESEHGERANFPTRALKKWFDRLRSLWSYLRGRAS
jgi:hypothetical protein